MTLIKRVVPLSETTNVALLEQVVTDQRQILTNVFNGTNITTIPQMWALCKSLDSPYRHVLNAFRKPDKEVQGYYEDGMRVDDDITLLWTDDKSVSPSLI